MINHYELCTSCGQYHYQNKPCFPHVVLRGKDSGVVCINCGQSSDFISDQEACDRRLIKTPLMDRLRCLAHPDTVRLAHDLDQTTTPCPPAVKPLQHERQIEVLIAYYEGNLKTWDTETITVSDDTEDLLATVLKQHPKWEGTTICGVFDYGMSDEDTNDTDEVDTKE